MFQFLCFYISVYFETLQTKTTIDPDKISKEISRNTINKLLESLGRNFEQLGPRSSLFGCRKARLEGILQLISLGNESQ